MEILKRQNETAVIEFVLVGFTTSRDLQKIIFCMFLTIYLLAILANLVIITVVSNEPRLHTPMYLFLCNFSFLEICYISVTLPKMLVDLMSGSHVISKSACIVQYYFFFVFGAMENFLLAEMAYDRFLALCYPLRYMTLMSWAVWRHLVQSSWLVSFLVPLMTASWMSRLQFCGPNQLDHFFCDFWPLLQLSCTDTLLPELTFLIIAWIILLGCFLFVLASYGYIIATIQQMPASTGKRKAISTCTSHLTVLSIYYSTVLYTYIRPRGAGRYHQDKIVSVFYSLATPLFNPVIYSLRNREMKEAMARILNKCVKH